MHYASLFICDSLSEGAELLTSTGMCRTPAISLKLLLLGVFAPTPPTPLPCSTCQFETGLGKPRSLLTLEYGGILNDETLELSADNLQAGLHVAACGYLIALLHLLGTAGRPFGLANLQIGTWQEISRERTQVQMSGASRSNRIICMLITEKNTIHSRFAALMSVLSLN